MRNIANIAKFTTKIDYIYVQDDEKKLHRLEEKFRMRYLCEFNAAASADTRCRSSPHPHVPFCGYR